MISFYLLGGLKRHKYHIDFLQVVIFDGKYIPHIFIPTDQILISDPGGTLTPPPPFFFFWIN